MLAISSGVRQTPEARTGRADRLFRADAKGRRRRRPVSVVASTSRARHSELTELVVEPVGNDRQRAMTTVALACVATCSDTLP
jgi:hypothetical protein